MAWKILRCHKDCLNEIFNGEHETVRLMVKKDEKVVMKIEETEERDEGKGKKCYSYRENK